MPLQLKNFVLAATAFLIGGTSFTSCTSEKKAQRIHKFATENRITPPNASDCDYPEPYFRVFTPQDSTKPYQFYRFGPMVEFREATIILAKNAKKYATTDNEKHAFNNFVDESIKSDSIRDIHLTSVKTAARLAIRFNEYNHVIATDERFSGKPIPDSIILGCLEKYDAAQKAVRTQDSILFENAKNLYMDLKTGKCK